MTLYHLNIDDEAIIRDVSDCGEFSRRLFDLGMIRGQRIRCTDKALFGTPIAYEVCGSKIALRKRDAKRVCVTI